jgi:Zn-dependent peptidase ImmA (M78 family)
LTAAYNRPPIPVHRIAEEHGVDVVFADFGKHADTVAGFCDFNQAKLFVNRKDRPDRQSFTIAHELGHWVLHRNLFLSHPERYPILARHADPNNSDPLEKEANAFAANLIVPGRLLQPIRTAPVAVLAKAFGVSPTMMSFRVRND